MSKTYRGFRTVTSPIQFHTAALDGTVIMAFQDGELIGSGRITEITDELVKIGGEYYIRANCTFTYPE